MNHLEPFESSEKNFNGTRMASINIPWRAVHWHHPKPKHHCRVQLASLFPRRCHRSLAQTNLIQRSSYMLCGTSQCFAYPRRFLWIFNHSLESAEAKRGQKQWCFMSKRRDGDKNSKARRCTTRKPRIHKRTIHWELCARVAFFPFVRKPVRDNIPGLQGQVIPLGHSIQACRRCIGVRKDVCRITTVEPPH